MGELTTWRWAMMLACLTACAGKSERAGGSSNSEAPVQQPAAGPVNGQPERAEPARHLLLVVELEPATHRARTLSMSSVDLPLPRRRGPARKAPWRVDVLSANGQVLYTAPLEDASTVRGEFRDDKSGETTGVTAQQRVAAVMLRLPWLEGAKDVRVVNVAGGESELGRVVYPSDAAFDAAPEKP